MIYLGTVYGKFETFLKLNFFARQGNEHHFQAEETEIRTPKPGQGTKSFVSVVKITTCRILVSVCVRVFFLPPGHFLELLLFACSHANTVCSSDSACSSRLSGFTRLPKLDHLLSSPPSFFVFIAPLSIVTLLRVSVSSGVKRVKSFRFLPAKLFKIC